MTHQELLLAVCCLLLVLQFARSSNELALLGLNKERDIKIFHYVYTALVYYSASTHGSVLTLELLSPPGASGCAFAHLAPKLFVCE